MAEDAFEKGNTIPIVQVTATLKHFPSRYLTPHHVTICRDNKNK